MRDIRSFYYQSDEDLASVEKINNDIESLRDRFNKISLENYTNNQNYDEIKDAYDRINVCVRQLDNKKIFDIMKQDKISIRDVYKLNNIYQTDVINDCLTKSLYNISGSSNNGIFSDIGPFIKNNIDITLTNSSYLKDSLLNNSSYHFSSDNTKINIFDLNKESYFFIVNSYRKSINLVEDSFDWFINHVGG